MIRPKVTKKGNLKKKGKRPPRLLKYPELNESKPATFQIKYEKKLSPIAKLTLSSFQNKHISYAIDDILYSFKSNPKERDNLLGILYSPVLSLQNDFSIHFFDIWIIRTQLTEISKVNKFLKNDSSNFDQFSYIRMTLRYKTRRIPTGKPEPLW